MNRLTERSAGHEAWKQREAARRPVWVVELRYDCGGTLVRPRCDTKYVRASTEKGAIATARSYSTLPWSAEYTIRRATPRDLECVPSPLDMAESPQLELFPLDGAA